MPLAANQLDPDEEVIAVLQDHWIVMVMPFLLYLLSWMLFLFFLVVSWSLKMVLLKVSFYFLLAAFITLVIGHHFFFLFYVEYLVSSLIITNKRLIEINFFPFFQDDVSYIELIQVHEIDKRKHGFWENLLNYGTVSLNIPRRGGTIVFKNIRYPSIFINLVEALKANKPLSPGDLRLTKASCPSKYQYLLKKK